MEEFERLINEMNKKFNEINTLLYNLNYVYQNESSVLYNELKFEIRRKEHDLHNTKSTSSETDSERK